MRNWLLFLAFTALHFAPSAASNEDHAPPPNVTKSSPSEITKNEIETLRYTNKKLRKKIKKKNKRIRETKKNNTFLAETIEKQRKALQPLSKVRKVGLAIYLLSLKGVILYLFLSRQKYKQRVKKHKPKKRKKRKRNSQKKS